MAEPLRTTNEDFGLTEMAYAVDDAGAGDAYPRDRGPVMLAILAWAAAIVWIAVVAIARFQAFGAGFSLDAVTALIAEVSAPLILIVALYMLAVRGVRSQGVRYHRLSAALRDEHDRLEAALGRASARIVEERAALADQSDRLMSVGEDAAHRLRMVSDKLREDLETAERSATGLHNAAQAARGDVTTLMGDIPRARAQTIDMTAALEAAGMTAHERAGALDAQIASLVARGREADEIAGGAAQKLAAQLARVESISGTAGARLAESADTMTNSIDAALTRAAEATDAARQGMEAQAAAMRALVDQSDAALAKTGANAAEAIARRVEDVTDRIHVLGALLTDHSASAETLIASIGQGIDKVDVRFAAIDDQADARNERLSSALAGLTAHVDSLRGALDQGSVSADAMIGRTETLVTALDAASREIGDALPAAFGRLDGHIDASRAKVAEVAPDVTRIEREASAALDRLLEAENALVKHRASLDTFAAQVETRLVAGKIAAADLIGAVEAADRTTRAIADGAGATLVEAMLRVRETSQAAADRAREALGAIVPDTAERMGAAVKAALDQHISSEVEAHIEQLAATADRAVAAANSASDRLMRQMLTIAETSAQVEARIAEAHGEIEEADQDNFARRVALLIESLNSTAIDVTKVLSNDVTDAAWAAYLKGDRGVFTRRAVRLLDAGEVREISRHYNDDPEFRDQVNRYIHDFEAMLRNVLATRTGSPIGVTLLSSDMGKLYVALAQAIDRLRT